MSAPPSPAKKTGVASFRPKLLIAMMLVVLALTSLGLFLAERKVAIEAARDLLQDFRNELAMLHGVQEVRHGALAERGRTLARRPRIHAALEDDALDLLYPSAQDELRDVLTPPPQDRPVSSDALQARFYRFLDRQGAVITPPDSHSAGELPPAAEAQLSLPDTPNEQQIGYVRHREGDAAASLDELLAVPILSRESGRVIATLVLGFEPVEIGHDRADPDLRSGLYLGGRLHLLTLPEADEARLAAELDRAVTQPGAEEKPLQMTIGGAPHLVFFKKLNPGSLYPPAYEVAVYSLASALARQGEIRTHALLAGALLLCAGLLASYILSNRFSAPVEELAVTSEENRTERQRAEAALESTSLELQRSARFSADASHQLKTPVTVLRAGIDELMTRENFPPAVYDQLSALLHQTYRITSVIDDLLLLSRMDAGRLQINFGTVDLSRLLEEWIDDLSALPDDLQVKVETNFPPGLRVAGERSYVTLIVQNLLENARKYNVPGGYICVFAREEGDYIALCVENSTSRPIPEAAREHIFERFHRCGMGENIPGQGLGLNLARELARLHGGDLRLVRSDDEGTEFEVRFRGAKVNSTVLAHSA